MDKNVIFDLLSSTIGDNKEADKILNIVIQILGEIKENIKQKPEQKNEQKAFDDLNTKEHILYFKNAPVTQFRIPADSIIRQRTQRALLNLASDVTELLNELSNPNARPHRNIKEHSIAIDKSLTDFEKQMNLEIDQIGPHISVDRPTVINSIQLSDLSKLDLQLHFLYIMIQRFCFNIIVDLFEFDSNALRYSFTFDNEVTEVFFNQDYRLANRVNFITQKLLPLLIQASAEITRIVIAYTINK